jgi:hypothetical protein
MRRALVVYESMFGNTEAVARAVAEGLSTRFATQVVDVGTAPTVVGPGVDLLVVAAPTHAFGMSHAATRRAAVGEGAHASAGTRIGAREWLAQLTAPVRPQGAAVIDTRLRGLRCSGSAARAARRQLRELGFDVAPAVSFWVRGTSGPLLDGELRRARTIGVELALHPTGPAVSATRLPGSPAPGLPPAQRHDDSDHVRFLFGRDRRRSLGDQDPQGSTESSSGKVVDASGDGRGKGRVPRQATGRHDAKELP